jgi:orotidine-5'-phosphate decarboxylase
MKSITVKSSNCHHYQAIPSDIPIILDSKRGDIDTTAQAYATSAFEIFNASAVTLSPYMGWDSVKPFVTGYTLSFFMCVMLLSSPYICSVLEQKSRRVSFLMHGDDVTMHDNVNMIHCSFRPYTSPDEMR